MSALLFYSQCITYGTRGNWQECFNGEQVQSNLRDQAAQWAAANVTKSAPERIRSPPFAAKSFHSDNYNQGTRSLQQSYQGNTISPSAQWVTSSQNPRGQYTEPHSGQNPPMLAASLQHDAKNQVHADLEGIFKVLSITIRYSF